MDILSDEKTVKVKYLVKHFGVSIETIRRDIKYLKLTDRITTSYGAISLKKEKLNFMENSGLKDRLQHCILEKKAIAQGALKYIPDRSTIALDIGTTVLELARLLDRKEGLTIITNSIITAGELSQNTSHEVYTTGGKLYKEYMITTGSFARNFLDNLASIDIFICSADGISYNTGVTEFLENVVDIKKKFVSIAERVIVLADYSKFRSPNLFQSCKSEEIDMLITDSKCPAEYVKEFRDHGIEVLVAG
jgi:DeoR/GlpR family transcriptional regulator of sugar metabolism